MATGRGEAADRFCQVVADDTGITVRNGLWHRHISRSDIVTFACATDGKYAAPVGDYMLWRRTQSLNFRIVATEENGESVTGTRSWAWDLRYRFDVGYAIYARDAQRLLATIVARAHIPLLALHDKRQRGEQRRQSSMVSALSMEGTLALPLAEANIRHRITWQAWCLPLANNSRSGHTPANSCCLWASGSVNYMSSQ